jgi:hypothetical protein
VHFRAGIRAVLRQPALILGEIAWRWAFGLAAWLLVIFAVRRILAHVDITQAELLVARHSDVFLIADACARIIVQVLPQLARECLVLAPAIAVLWVAAATVGRAVTLQTLLSSDAQPSTAAILTGDAPADDAAAASESKHPYRSRNVNAARTHFGRLTLLNAFRALFTLATLVAFFGALVLAGAATQNVTAGAVIGVALGSVVALFWSLVNWFLALAPIWIVRDGHTALQSIADSLDLFRRSPAPYASIATWFGLLRAGVLVAALVLALIAAQASPAAAIALGVVIALVYFAVADFLYIARLAAFVTLEERSPLSALTPQPLSDAPQPLPAPDL